jgi:hypothetical protein
MDHWKHVFVHHPNVRIHPPTKLQVQNHTDHEEQATNKKKMNVTYINIYVQLLFLVFLYV